MVMRLGRLLNSLHIYVGMERSKWARQIHFAWIPVNTHHPGYHGAIQLQHTTRLLYSHATYPQYCSVHHFTSTPSTTCPISYHIMHWAPPYHVHPKHAYQITTTDVHHTSHTLSTLYPHYPHPHNYLCSMLQHT